MEQEQQQEQQPMEIDEQLPEPMEVDQETLLLTDIYMEILARHVKQTSNLTELDLRRRFELGHYVWTRVNLSAQNEEFAVDPDEQGRADRMVCNPVIYGITKGDLTNFHLVDDQIQAQIPYEPLKNDLSMFVYFRYLGVTANTTIERALPWICIVKSAIKARARGVSRDEFMYANRRFKRLYDLAAAIGDNNIRLVKFPLSHWPIPNKILHLFETCANHLIHEAIESIRPQYCFLPTISPNRVLRNDYMQTINELKEQFNIHEPNHVIFDAVGFFFLHQLITFLRHDEGELRSIVEEEEEEEEIDENVLNELMDID